jgi:hypothetical protein
MTDTPTAMIRAAPLKRLLTHTLAPMRVSPFTLKARKNTAAIVPAI